MQPQRSAGGHRRYSRFHLRLAAWVRELVDQGTPLAAACRIVTWKTNSTKPNTAMPHRSTTTDRHTSRPTAPDDPAPSADARTH
jgi:DNA-binding transcriptional MerR regulator